MWKSITFVVNPFCGTISHNKKNNDKYTTEVLQSSTKCDIVPQKQIL